MKKINQLALLLLIFSTTSIMSYAQTVISGVINTNQIWTPAGNPYFVAANTNITQGTTITVKPGVVITGQKNVTHSIIVDGLLRLEGHIDTPIFVNNVQLDFTKKAADHFPTGGGCMIEYTNFDSLYNYTAQIRTQEASLKINGCNFKSFGYGVQTFNTKDSTRIDITNCKFMNTDGYAIYTSGSSPTLNVMNCLFKNINANYIGGKFNFIENTLDTVDFTYYDFYDNSILNCNTFKNFTNGIRIYCYNKDSNATLDVMYNTFDTMGYMSFYPMIELLKNNPNYKINGFRFQYNNILYNKATIAKFIISGSNPVLSNYRTLNLLQNFWGTTDSTQVPNMIKDYNDDINIFAKADFNPILKSQNTQCLINTSKCKADFIIAFDTTYMYNVYLIDNSSGVDSNTEYTWILDTFIFKNQKNPKYYHNGFGKIKVCLIIYNKNIGCSSQYCDSIGIDSTGNLMAIQTGFFVNVLSWQDFKNLSNKKPLPILQFQLLPNPSNEYLNLLFAKPDVYSISIMNSTGRTLYKINQTVRTNSYQINTKDFSNGIYYLHLENKSGKSTQRFIVQH